MSDQVADLHASFGLQTDIGSFSKGAKALDGVQAKVDKLEAKQARAGRDNGRMNVDKARGVIGLGKAYKMAGDEADKAGKREKEHLEGQKDGVMRLAMLGAAYFGFNKAKDALIDFNAGLESSRVTIAGMFAMVKKTDLADQYAQADITLANLQRRAKTLPGTTQDYIATLSQISQPVLDAGGSFEQLENITVRSVIAAKSFGIAAEVAARDVDQAVRGQFHIVDQLTGKVLGMAGYKGEAGRSKFNALSQEKRLAELDKAFSVKQLDQLGDAQGATFSGQMSTFGDNISIALGKIGLPLFTALTAKVKELNAWFDVNEAKVKEYTQVIGGKLVGAFELLIDAIGFVMDHATFFQGVLIGLGAFITAFAIQAALDWAIAFWPITLAIAAIATLHAAISWLFDDLDDEANKASGATGEVGTTSMGPLQDGLGNVVDKLGHVTTAAERAKAALASMHDFNGKPLDAAALTAGASLGGGYSSASPVLPSPALPRGVSDPARLAGADGLGFPPASTQVNVNVTGNMPPGWIDAKVDTAIKEHHDTTWRNAAAATQTDEDE